jgi:hypothetical protein
MLLPIVYEKKRANPGITLLAMNRYMLPDRLSHKISSNKNLQDYLKGNLSVESHLTFETERNIHYEECIAWRGCAILFARKQTEYGAQTTQSCMT